ncbi:MAG TPA: DUF1648 domain-containing protein [Opitutaceae bacterium]|jgi:hypothetical protein|nr:DUF1648 domain-containing protein [Opitutaceae bacterium]
MTPPATPRLPSLRLATGAYVLGLVVLAAVLAYGGSHLPPRIAVHFDAAGHANRWGSRNGQLFGLATFGIAVPALIVGITSVARLFPPEMLNVPNAEHWRKPENFSTACAYARAVGVWLAAAITAWWAQFIGTTIAANLTQPPHLDAGLVWVSSAVLLAIIFVTVRRMQRFFRHIPPRRR